MSPAYPYAPTPLRPVWHDRKAQALGVFAVLCTAVGLAARWPFALADADTLALLVLFPGALAFVLAFAPRPATRANRIAKDLVTVWTALGVFSGALLPLMIVTVPVWLAVAVFAARLEASRRIWGDDP